MEARVIKIDSLLFLLLDQIDPTMLTLRYYSF